MRFLPNELVLFLNQRNGDQVKILLQIRKNLKDILRDTPIVVVDELRNR